MRTGVLLLAIRNQEHASQACPVQAPPRRSPRSRFPWALPCIRQRMLGHALASLKKILPRWGRWLAQRDGKRLTKKGRDSGCTPPRAIPERPLPPRLKKEGARSPSPWGRYLVKPMTAPMPYPFGGSITLMWSSRSALDSGIEGAPISKSSAF